MFTSYTFTLPFLTLLCAVPFNDKQAAIESPASGLAKVGASETLTIRNSGPVLKSRAAATATFVSTEAMAPIAEQDVKEVKAIAGAVNGFAFALYEKLRQQDGNLFLSPASISNALAMTLAGAAGQTEQEMTHVLNLDRDLQLSQPRIHAAYGKLNTLLNSGGNQDGYTLRTANRLWAQQSSALLPAFLKVTRDEYGAELAKLDFRQTEKARAEINQWIEQQTNHKIANLIPPGVLAADTRLVLTNAIYFLGGWQNEFAKESTKDEPFFVTPTKTSTVPLMAQTNRFRYGETDHLQVLELPYRGHEISMLVLLPKKTESLAAIEDTLGAESVNRDLGSLRQRKVHLFLPKVKMTAEFSLKKVLSAMGMPNAFTEAADFSRMTSDQSLMISEVLHKAFVDVNEKGTEAAAATGVIVAPTSALPRPEEPVVFRADHPFVFLLRHNPSEVILFAGRVSDPKQ